MINAISFKLILDKPKGRKKNATRSLREYLSNGSGQKTNNAFVRYGNDTLPVNFNYPVTDSDATTLGDPSSQKAANLFERLKTKRLVWYFVI